MSLAIVWSYFHFLRESHKGGLTKYRTTKNNMDDLAYLQRKWGKYLSVNRKKSVLGLGIAVRRKQPLIPSSMVK